MSWNSQAASTGNVHTADHGQSVFLWPGRVFKGDC